MRIANNKHDALTNLSLGIDYEYPKELLKLLYDFHTDIGATRELPADKVKLKEYLIRLHETIAIKNPLFPDTTDFENVYGIWMMAVIYEVAPRQGNNISALARCFNDWYKLNADQFIPSSQRQEVSKYRTIKEFTSVEVARLHDIVEMLNDGDLIGGLFSTGGAHSFFKRLKTEHEVRGL
jgi:hypothetical protein